MQLKKPGEKPRGISEYKPGVLNMIASSAVFQPTVSTKTRKIVGFEALARFRNLGTDEIVSPGELIPALTLIEHKKLFELMHERSLRALVKMNGTPVPISLNVPPDLISFGYVDEILASTPDYYKPFVKLEILEYAISDWKKLYIGMLRLYKKGFGFYIDDFGLNAEHWQSLLLPGIEKIKFDRLFVPSVEPGFRGQKLKTLDSWALWTRLNHVGSALEGVEHDWEYQQIARIVDEVQGYFTGRPQPIDFWLEPSCAERALSPKQRRGLAPPL